MSKFSVLCQWTIAEDDLGRSMYGYARRISKSGKLFGEYHFMMIRPSRTECINTLVHEINECEIFNLLRTKFLEEIGGDYHKIYIRINKKLKKKYPWIFSTICNELKVTHIIAPYGVKNCIMSRRSIHLSWGKRGK